MSIHEKKTFRRAISRTTFSKDGVEIVRHIDLSTHIGRDNLLRLISWGIFSGTPMTITRGDDNAAHTN